MSAATLEEQLSAALRRIAELEPLLPLAARYLWQKAQVARVYEMAKSLSNAPLIGIIDDTDCPEAKMLAVIWRSAMGTIHWHYVAQRKCGPVRRCDGFPHLFTPLADFGMSATLADGSITTAPSGAPCIATYPDGVPWKWQGGRPPNHLDRAPVNPLMRTYVAAVIAGRPA